METGWWINTRCNATLQFRMTMIEKLEFRKKVRPTEQSPITDRPMGRSLTIVSIRWAIACCLGRIARAGSSAMRLSGQRENLHLCLLKIN